MDFKAKDINNLPLYVGEKVYYARKQNYSASGELKIATITKIIGVNQVKLGSYTSTDTKRQIAKIDIGYTGNENN
jgi:hypothetical protein